MPIAHGGERYLHTSGDEARSTSCDRQRVHGPLPASQHVLCWGLSWDGVVILSNNDLKRLVGQ